MDTTDQTIAMRRIDRAVHELRGGYPVLLAQESGASMLVISAETMSEAHREQLLALAEEGASLVISAVRASRLGLCDDAEAACCVPLDALHGKPDALAQLIDPLQGTLDGVTDLRAACTPADATASAALELCKIAGLLPAVVVATMDIADRAEWSVENHILAVEVPDVAAYKDGLVTTLTQVSNAHVPLHLAENARVLAFRPRYGVVEHLAVCIGEPEAQSAPLVRLHSSCVTGDILGSMRCDCGEQLHEAIRRVAEEGAGIVLYLSQEGRGIGIVNKLRAYQLQDAGLDTLDANEEMGFAADERSFDVAAAMLRSLGIFTVRLLSNNPDKVKQLEACGITVQERVSLALPANDHNRRYLETKEQRCGHVF